MSTKSASESAGTKHVRNIIVWINRGEGRRDSLGQCERYKGDSRR